MYRLIGILCFLLYYGHTEAQKVKDQVYVDKQGIMRWSDDHTELYGFGVNYTLPFAHEYRRAVSTGTQPEEAIRMDVYHMARLDLDFYRVHVWDTEISDSLGNLIDNEHLRLFDFLLNEMKSRGMRFIITPIAYWGNGWPEKDGKTPGFSAKYGKEACLTNPEAIRAQENYLKQFVSHVNRYTGKAYKDDPAVIGFEISNEPHHGGSRENVTRFINTMVSSIRKSGCTKLLFYNMSHSIHLADAYLDADIQGGTFQWYPTGLVANHQINGNFLPHVASYPIPFAQKPAFLKMAKIIYEFDAADAGGNYLYPAMAETFRHAGMQIAAHFAYDALCSAPWNTNYGTHFMNLAYAPNKAISLKIASAVFHNQPLYTAKHESLKVSYSDDLAEWITMDKFFYSNNTSAVPPDISMLREIAGCGSSPVVSYTGSGAYFLDKLADGIWRLEILPDAYWIKDPYSPVSPRVQKAAVVHAIRFMKVDLPDLGNNFSAQPVNTGNSFSPQVNAAQFHVKPGVYLLKAMNAKADLIDGEYRNIKINEYVAPESDLKETLLLSNFPTEATAGKSIDLNFEIASLTPVLKADIILWNGRQRKTLNCNVNGNSRFNAIIPADIAQRGFLNYRLIIETENDTVIFPGCLKGSPFSWENNHAGNFKIRIVQPESPLFLWEPENDWDYSYKIWSRDVDIEPSDLGSTLLSIRLGELPSNNPSNPGEKGYSFKFCFRDKICGRANELVQKKMLVIQLANKGGTDQPMEIGLIDRNSSVVSVNINATPGDKIYKLPLETFSQSDFLIIPRPYPDFLPYSVSTGEKEFDEVMAETLQITVKPGTHPGADLQIGKVWLE